MGKNRGQLPVASHLFRTSNLIGPIWVTAHLFSGQVLLSLCLFIVFPISSARSSKSFKVMNSVFSTLYLHTFLIVPILQKRWNYREKIHAEHFSKQRGITTIFYISMLISPLCLALICGIQRKFYLETRHRRQTIQLS